MLTIYDALLLYLVQFIFFAAGNRSVNITNTSVRADDQTGDNDGTLTGGDSFRLTASPPVRVKRRAQNNKSVNRTFDDVTSVAATQETDNVTSVPATQEPEVDAEQEEEDVDEVIGPSQGDQLRSTSKWIPILYI